jgi:hypothetical protein
LNFQLAKPELPTFEPFVDEKVVAEFLQLTSRRVLEMARRKELPAHPIGNERKTWRFRLSEISAHFSHRPSSGPGVTIPMAVPVAQGRKSLE